MPFCVICRADYDGSEGGPCPKCGTGQRSEEAPTNTSGVTAKAAPEPPPAHLAVVDAAQKAMPPKPSESFGDIRPAKRLVSSAGPSVPVRRAANDSVPSSWMARLEAAKLGTNAAPTSPPQPPPIRTDGPPPLKPSQSNGQVKNAPKKEQAPVAKPAHLLVAQLEAEDRTRSEELAAQTAALFEEDRSAEIAKVEINLPEETRRKRWLPDWAVITIFAVAVLGVVAFFVMRTRTEPPPKAEIDPVVAREAERKRSAVAALEEGHRLAQEGKPKADEALKAYTRALELDATMADAERGLAIAFALKNDDARAVEHYRSYLKLSPSAPDAADVRAIIAKYEERKKREAEGEAAAEADKKQPARAKKRSR